MGVVVVVFGGDVQMMLIVGYYGCFGYGEEVGVDQQDCQNGEVIIERGIVYDGERG